MPLPLRSQSGQASVEAVAIVPFVALCVLMAWQLALAGQTLWLAAGAARAAARADVVGQDAERAARSALPRSLERDLSVKELDGGGVRVQLRVPLLVGAWRSPVLVSASSSLGPGR